MPPKRNPNVVPLCYEIRIWDLDLDEVVRGCVGMRCVLGWKGEGKTKLSWVVLCLPSAGRGASTGDLDLV